MERRKNLVLFTGNSEASKRKAVSAWIEAFVAKHGESNVVRIRKDSFSAEAVATELLSPPFFAEKRLVVFEDLPRSLGIKLVPGTESENTGDDVSAEKPASFDAAASVEGAVLACFADIPDSTVAVFVANDPDPKSGLYEKLLFEADLRDFPELSGAKARDYVQDRLPGISNAALEILVSRTEGREWALREGVEKLSLAYGEGVVDSMKVDEAVPETEAEAKIFDLADAIVAAEDRALSMLSLAMKQKSPHEILSTLLSTYRKKIRVDLLLLSGEGEEQIRKILAVKNEWEVAKRRRAGEKDRRAHLAAYSALVKFQSESRIGTAPGSDDEAELSLAVTRTIIFLRKS